MNLRLNLGRGVFLGRNVSERVVGRCGVRGGDWDLEAEILEFMRNSGKPAAFPSKDELVEAGRMDLVKGIVREGGWLALGWDLEDEVVGCREDVVMDLEAIQARQCVTQDPEFKSDTGLEKSSNVEEEDRSMDLGSESSWAESSSNETLEEATGVEGILGRLEKERSTAYGITLKDQEMLDHALSDNGRSSHGELPFGSLSNAVCNQMETVVGHDRSSDNDISNRLGNRSKDSLSKNLNGPDFIRKRLRSLELELSNALQSLKSKSDESTRVKVSQDLSEETQNVPDAWEFPQTEIMHAKDTLRSIRAKLAILEGKMSLAIIDAQKMTEAKQKKIDGARQALQLLRTTLIIWPHSASDVLLAGSFDGWTTQRRMKKSTTGVNSLSLKLYPGVYEIKFIVEGVWKIDPLLPITRNNGFQNNILVVT
ncbi:unnamed protein product [Rhodiola kirilowii]